MFFRSRRLLVLAALFLACRPLWFAPPASALETLGEGMKAPDFSLSPITGKARTFADVRGERLTVLVFWSTWSAKSAQALAQMEKLHEKYREQGLGIVGVNADDQKSSPATLAEIRNTQEKLKIGFPMLVDRGLVSFRDYGVVALPTILVMDRERVIRRVLSGYPLVGAEELADYIVAAIAGERKPVVAARTGYQPDRNALRLYAMGETALKSREGEEMAELWFKKAGAADPAFVLPHLSLGKLYLRRGDTALAQVEFREALTREPDNPVALCESGMILVNSGKTAEGVSLFETALKGKEPYPPCYAYAGYGYGVQGKLAEAAKLFDHAAQANPLDYTVHVYRGKLFERTQDWNGAAKAYEKALEIILRLN